MSSAESIAAVRQLIWDPPRWVQGETLGIGDGRRVAFQLGAAPVLPESVQVSVDGTDVTDTSTVEASLGLVTLAAAPEAGAVVSADFSWALLSEAAIDSQLEAHGGDLLLTAARCLEVLLLDPTAIAGLALEGVRIEPGARQQVLEHAIMRYRQAGSYGRFQSRIDAVCGEGDG